MHGFKVLRELGSMIQVDYSLSPSIPSAATSVLSFEP